MILFEVIRLAENEWCLTRSAFEKIASQQVKVTNPHLQHTMKGSKKKMKSSDKLADVYAYSDDEKDEQLERMDIDGVCEYEMPKHFDDDDEIDEDEAFNSDDEEAYGHMFNKSASNPVGDDCSEEEEEEGDLLSDLLGTTPAPRLSTLQDASALEEQPDSEPTDESEEEEEEEEEEEASDEEEDDDDTHKHAQLLALVDEMAPKVKQAKHYNEHQVEKESDFLTGTSMMSATPFTMDELMGQDISTSADASVTKLKYQLRTFKPTSQSNAKSAAHVISKPMAPVQEARITRKVVYDDTSKSVGDKYQEVVKKNREADTIDFTSQLPPKDNISSANLAQKFQPKTEFEKSIHDVLQQSGYGNDEKIVANEKAESHQLTLLEESSEGRPKLTVEEVQARQKELAKLRVLMFYESQKSKRVKKIKSKLYHKIRNKKSDAHQDPLDDTETLDEESAALAAAERRAEERMTLKHNNTSKWIKHQLKRGINADQNTRQAIATQLQRGQELRQKQSKMDDSGDSDHESLPGQDLMTETTELLAEIENDASLVLNQKGLSGMKFMQRAAEKQRLDAKAQTQALLKELQEEAKSDDDDEMTMQKSKKKPTRLAPTAQDRALVEGQLKHGNQFQTQQVMMHQGHASRSSGAIAVTLDEEEAQESLMTKASAAVPNYDINAPDSNTSNNPWIDESQTTMSTKKVSHKSKNSKNKRKAAPQLNVQAAIDSLDAATTSSATEPVLKKPKQSSTEISQEELVERAFSSYAHAENEFEDIEKEKDHLVSKDTNVKVGKAVAQMIGVAGWGSWSGLDMKKSNNQRRRESKAKEFLTEAKTSVLKNRRDQNLKHVIIREKQDKKSKTFTCSSLPYPFTSRAQYELAMRNPLGQDWNTMKSNQQMTQPKVITRAGTIIEPLKVKTKSTQKIKNKTMQQSAHRKARF